jgi:predicted DNA-binding transcriptional regulator AlpA
MLDHLMYVCGLDPQMGVMGPIYDRIIRIREVIFLTGECRTKLYEKIKLGRFPKQRRLGGPGSKSVGWSLLEIQAYIQITLAGGEYIAPEE